MLSERSERALPDELPGLLRARALSLRQLAQQAGVDSGHLSRVINRQGNKVASAELARAVAIALELPEDYFPEVRTRAVVDAVKADPALRERLYRQLEKR